MRNGMEILLRGHPDFLHMVPNRFGWHWHRSNSSHPEQNCMVKGLCLVRNFIAFSLSTSLHHIYIYDIYQNIYIYISLSRKNLKTRHTRGDRAESLQGEQRPSIRMDLTVHTTRSLAFLRADSKAARATTLSPRPTFSVWLCVVLNREQGLPAKLS